MGKHSFDFDLFVIGGGSGGVRAARWSGGLGAKVALCEAGRIGGACVLRGCIPKKLMVYASEFPADVQLMQSYGWQVDTPEFCWDTLKKNRDQELSRLSGLYTQTLQKNGVTQLQGIGQVIGPHEVLVNQTRYTAQHILIATGGTPWVPGIPGIELGKTSDAIFGLDRLPRRLAILGGGFIGVEFASLFKGLGSDVALFIRSGHILRGFDQDCRHFLQNEMLKRKIQVYAETEIECLRQTDHCLELQTKDGTLYEFDEILVATGRRPNTACLGLNQIGIKQRENGAIMVDEYWRTNIPSIYAVGDVIDQINLTPVATAQGTALAENLFNHKKIRLDLSLTPSAVFAIPPLATVGLSEAKARQQYGQVDVYESDFRPLKYTLSDKTERTYVKLIVDPSSQRVLGAHMVGKDAPEIIQGFAVALKVGATKQDFDQTLGIHPTSAEEFVTLRNKVER